MKVSTILLTWFYDSSDIISLHETRESAVTTLEEWILNQKENHCSSLWTKHKDNVYETEEKRIEIFELEVLP